MPPAPDRRPWPRNPTCWVTDYGWPYNCGGTP